MSTRTTIGFVLPCSMCGEAVYVGETALHRRCDLTFYFEPGGERRGAFVVGVSGGSGDTFRCLACAAPELTGVMDGLEAAAARLGGAP